jgi:hypothetical protein
MISNNAPQELQPERLAGTRSDGLGTDLADAEAGSAASESQRVLAGDGPPYIKLGGAIRYAENSLQQWMKGQQRTSTSG